MWTHLMIITWFFHSLHVAYFQFLEGLSSLDFRRDEFIKRKIKQIFAAYFHIFNQVCQIRFNEGGSPIPISQPQILIKSHCLSKILILFQFSGGGFCDESQFHCMKSYFPSEKIGNSHLPFYPFKTLYYPSKLPMICSIDLSTTFTLDS